MLSGQAYVVWHLFLFHGAGVQWPFLWPNCLLKLLVLRL